MKFLRNTVCLYLLLLVASVFSSTTPIVSNGVLDLTSFDFTNSNTPIIGNFNFYWKEFIQPFSQKHEYNNSISVKVPSVWNSYRISNKRCTGFGFGTYRVKLLLNPKDVNRTLSLKLLVINSSFELLANGKKIASSGKIGKSKADVLPRYNPMVVDFVPDSSVVELLFYVSNFSFKRGGLRERILIGTPENIHESRERAVGYELFIFGAILIMGLQSLTIYLLRKKEKVHLYFAIICISVSIRILVTGERFLMHVVDDFPLKLMMIMILAPLTITPFFFSLYIRTIYEKFFSAIFIKPMFFVAFLLFLGILFGSIAFSATLIPLIQTYAMFTLMIVIYVLFRAIIHREAGALIMLISTIAITLTAINDILYDLSLTPFINLFPTGLFIFLFSQAILLSRRNSAIQSNLEFLSKNISETNIALKKFVPEEFLLHLDKKNITDIKLGDQVLRDMSVLFTEVRNFSQYSENSSPQENINFLNSYFDNIWPSVTENSGFIDKYVDNSVMALFPQDASNSIAAAIDMQRRVVGFNKKNNLINNPISIGVGIHTGHLMLGTVGHKNRMAPTVISDTVNLASRMVSLTKLYGAGIIVSEESVKTIKSDFKSNYRFLDRVQVRGKSSTVKLIEILDGLPEKDFSLKMRCLDSFNCATSAYKNGEIAEAKNVFLSILAINPDDLAIQYYLKRCEKYLISGIGNSWDGIQVFYA